MTAKATQNLAIDVKGLTKRFGNKIAVEVAELLQRPPDMR